MLAGLLFIGTGAQAGYNAPQRFSLFEDKLHTHRLMFPQNFFLDVGLYINPHTVDFLDNIRSITEKQKGAPQLKYAQQILRDNNKTEQIVHAETQLKVRLPRFRLGRFRFLPLLEIDARLGGIVGIQQRIPTFQEILDFVGNDVPTSIRDALVNCPTPPGPGDDIIQNAIVQRCLDRSSAASLTGKYYYPADPEIPQVFVYGKLESRVGSRLYYLYSKRFKGDVKLYWRGRSDVKIRISDSTLRNNNEILEIPHGIHHSALALDYRFRYQRKAFSGFLAVEEVPLATLKEKEGLSAPLHHAPSALWRGHLQYRRRLLSFLLFRPFLGVHHRNDYNLSDGLYAGGEFLFQKRRSILCRLRGQVDPEHLTTSVSFGLPWVLLSGWYKMPLKEEANGIKLPALIGFNLNIVP